MADSGILQQAIKIEKASKAKATHFALCNGDKIRYLIDLKGGKKRLSGNIATYSAKLGLLMKLLDILPFYALQAVKLGYFIRVQLHPEVKKMVDTIGKKSWNMIVGTYDEKQKLVLQCFNQNGTEAFVKIGNRATEKEMTTEMEFLTANHSFKSFEIPILMDKKYISKDCPFNIQITEEVVGEKVEPVLSREIVDVYQELSAETKDGFELSHGDFAPWNLKKSERYTLFDWEHCGYRMKGFDLMHYATIVEVVLNGKGFSEAFDSGLEKIKSFVPEFVIDKEAFLEEFKKLRTQIG